MTSDARNSTRKIANKIFAIPAAASANPLNPNTAAMRAIKRNSKAQFNIGISFPSSFDNCLSSLLAELKSTPSTKLLSIKSTKSYGFKRT